MYYIVYCIILYNVLYSPSYLDHRSSSRTGSVNSRTCSMDSLDMIAETVDSQTGGKEFCYVLSVHECSFSTRMCIEYTNYQFY